MSDEGQCRNCGQPITKAGGRYGVYAHVGIDGAYGPVQCQGGTAARGPFAEPEPACELESVG